jgi:uncharacterized Tic20 family protein
MPRYDDDEDDDEDDRPRLRRRCKEPHRGQTILLLGIVAIAFVHLMGPFVWWMGSVDLKKMREGRMDRRGESETRLGYILGIITTVLLVIGMLIGLMIFAMFIFGFGMFAVAAANAPR